MHRKIITGVICFLFISGGIYLFSVLRPANKQISPNLSQTDSSKADQHTATNKAKIAKKTNIPSESDEGQNIRIADNNTSDFFIAATNIKTAQQIQEKRNHNINETEIESLSPDELGKIITNYDNSFRENHIPVQKALSKLCSLGMQDSPAAIQTLTELSYKVDNNRILHQVLQTLGRTAQPEADNALFDALNQNLSNPVETTRICSYFMTTSSGTFEPSVIDGLIKLLENPEINPESRETIINSIRNKGGSYGFEQIRSNFLN